MSKWHEYHQMVSSRRCVDARVPAKFLLTIWTHQQGIMIKGVHDRITTCFNVAAFARNTKTPQKDATMLRPPAPVCSTLI